jgi:hypothetical protein
MRLLKLVTSSSLIAFVMTIVPVQAMSQHEHSVLCPSVEKIWRAAPFINTAKKDSGNWMVYADKPVFQEQGIAWSIGLFFPRDYVDNQSDAIRMGQNIVGSVQSVLYEEAFEEHGNFMCGYYVKANLVVLAYSGEILPINRALLRKSNSC